MPNTYTLIASSTVSSSTAANMSFSSIPGTYTDLLLKTSARTDGSSQNIKVTFNGSSSGYSERWVYGGGTSGTGSGSATTNGYFYIYYTTQSSDTANTFGNSELYIPNYAGSNNKSVSEDAVEETNGNVVYMALGAGLWSNSAAITSITLTPLGGNFTQYSTAYLYGIKNS